MWLRVADKEMFSRVAQQIMNSPYYTDPALKCETESSGVSEFLEAFRDIIWGMRWLLAPATLATLSLVIANAISISVRQRRTELAVLKVLGFRPRQVLLLVLGEALLIGTLAGLGSALATYLVINDVLGGLKFPIAFFSSFYIPAKVPVVGGRHGRRHGLRRGPPAGLVGPKRQGRRSLCQSRLKPHPAYEPGEQGCRQPKETGKKVATDEHSAAGGRTKLLLSADYADGRSDPGRGQSS